MGSKEGGRCFNMGEKRITFDWWWNVLIESRMVMVY